MTEHYTAAEEQQRQVKARRMLTYLIILAIVMFFAGLTSAYVVSMTGGYWVRFSIPAAFYWSTAFIVISSLSAQFALMAARQDQKSRVTILLMITLALGLAFSSAQFKGWGQLVEKGNYVKGKVLKNSGQYGVDYTITKGGVTLVHENGEYFLPSDELRRKPLNADLSEQQNLASSYFYALTGAHLAHIVFGLLSLLVMAIMAAKVRYSKDDHVGLWAGVIFWHFLGGLWIYLLLFLTFIH